MMMLSGTPGIVRSLAGKWPERIGHLLTPFSGNSMAAILATGQPWAADNGAFSGLDVPAFRRMLGKVAGEPRCLFVVVPDVVGDAHHTHHLFETWWDEVSETGQPLAYVGQDGAEYLDLPWGHFQAFFVGGSTEWKLSAAVGDLCAEAKRRGKHIHMGRVNSRRRMDVAAAFGCDSVDGSSASIFGAEKVARYCAWLDQLTMQSRLFTEV